MVLNHKTNQKKKGLYQQMGFNRKNENKKVGF